MIGRSTISVYESIHEKPLKQVVRPRPNDNSGLGQFQIGMLKKPTGDFGDDLLTSGFQSKNFEEAQIYGGIFVEDSRKGCISL